MSTTKHEWFLQENPPNKKKDKQFALAKKNVQSC